MLSCSASGCVLVFLAGPSAVDSKFNNLVAVRLVWSFGQGRLYMLCN